MNQSSPEITELRVALAALYIWIILLSSDRLPGRYKSSHTKDGYYDDL